MNKYFLLNILIALLFHPVLAQKNNFKTNTKTAVVENYKPVFKQAKLKSSEISLYKPSTQKRQNFETAVAEGKYAPVVSRLHNNAKRFHLSQLKGDAILKNLHSESVRLEIFPGEIIEVETTIVPSEGAHGSVFYSGFNSADKGAKNGSMALTIIDEKVYGKVWNNGKLYIIQPLHEGKLHLIAERKATQTTAESCDNKDNDCCALSGELLYEYEPKEVCHEDIAHLIDGPTTLSAAKSSIAGGNVTHIVTFFNAGAVDYYGSSTAATSIIAQYINETNIALSNSQVNACLHSVEITYYDSTNRNDAVNRRNAVCADIAASVGTGYRDEGDVVNCGNAIRYNEGGSSRSNIVASPYCSDIQFTFTHELGHIYDANHDDDDDAGDYRGGSIINGEAKSLLDKSNSGSRVLYFTNPSVSYNGYVTGSSSRRNADRMNQTVGSVANFNGGSDCECDAPPSCEYNAGNGWKGGCDVDASCEDNVILNAPGNNFAGWTWNWSGPGNFTQNASPAADEITLSNVDDSHIGTYLGQWTDTKGCTGTLTFNLSINGIGGGSVATFYEDWDYNGASWSLGSGTYDGNSLNNSPVGNNSISSFQLQAGYEITVAENADGSGAQQTFTSSQAQMTTWNDRISYIQISTPNSACPTCDDGIQNQDETGIDCGGSCPSCPTCFDGVQNGNETGIDCGGTSCPACFTCFDGIQNGNETGIDCGGTDCVACQTCFDGIQNQDETGIDCGGSCASACPDCFVTLSNTGCNTVQVVYYADLNATPVTVGTLAAGSSQNYPADMGSFWAYLLDNQVIAYWNTDCNNPNFIN